MSQFFLYTLTSHYAPLFCPASPYIQNLLFVDFTQHSLKIVNVYA